MRHLKNFGPEQSPNKLFKESYSDEYYYILDIRDALGSLAPKQGYSGNVLHISHIE